MTSTKLLALLRVGAIEQHGHELCVRWMVGVANAIVNRLDRLGRAGPQQLARFLRHRGDHSVVFQQSPADMRQRDRLAPGRAEPGLARGCGLGAVIIFVAVCECLPEVGLNKQSPSIVRAMRASLARAGPGPRGGGLLMLASFNLTQISASRAELGFHTFPVRPRAAMRPGLAMSAPPAGARGAGCGIKTERMFLNPSMQLHPRDAREIGIEPGGHAAARLLHGVKFGHWAIDSEIAPGVGYLIVVKLNNDGATLASFRMHEVADVFHRLFLRDRG